LRGWAEEGKLNPSSPSPPLFPPQTCRALEAAQAKDNSPRLKPQKHHARHSLFFFFLFLWPRTLEGERHEPDGALVGLPWTICHRPLPPPPPPPLSRTMDQRFRPVAMGFDFYELMTGKMPSRADFFLPPPAQAHTGRKRALPVPKPCNTIPATTQQISASAWSPTVKLRTRLLLSHSPNLAAGQGGRAAATCEFPSSSRP